MKITATVTYRCATCGDLITDGTAVLVDPEGNIVPPDTEPLPAGTTSHHAAHIEEDG
jgi:hypothetical protein